MDFKTAFSGITKTDRGAITFQTSNSHILDFFSNVCRPFPDNIEERMDTLLYACFKENPLLALKCGFAKRDIRGNGGAGERKVFEIFFRWLYRNYPNTALHNLKWIPHFGYWKDLHSHLEGMSDRISSLYAIQLQKDLDLEGGEGSLSLCSKWCPSVNGSVQRKWGLCKEIAVKMGFSKSTWSRDMRVNVLTPLRKRLEIVESKMCANRWSDISYSKVPSIAMNIYRKAFQVHDPDGFETWQELVKDGKETVNASVLMPHQLVKNYCPQESLCIHSLTYTDVDKTTELQWSSLIDAGRAYMDDLKRNGGVTDGNFMMLALPDLSGSMVGTPMMVSLGLSIYISKVCPEPFRDMMISFSEKPTVINLEGKDTLLECLQECSKSENIGYNTNLQATFDLILKQCVKNSVPQSKMVKKIVAVSDMQFDDAVVGGISMSNLNAISLKYKQAGYEMPQIVFWNVQCKNESPAKKDERGIAMIAGWSKNIMTTIMKGEIPDPQSIMMDVLTSPRYDCLEWVK
jgi:hypothetical protein